MTLRAASCFSGIGAPEMAMPHWDWLWCAEIEKFPSAVMAVRHPESINLGDVTADDFMQRASSFGRVDVLAGGPPCQAFSVAGLRKSMDDDRGNLSLRFVKIAHAIRPRNLLVENVPGWLNTPDNAFGCFLGAILGSDDALCSPADGKWPRSGMASGPLGRLCWATLDAQFFGLAQRRQRVFVVVDFGGGADPASVLFESESLLRHSPPSRSAGKDVAGTIAARTTGGGGLGTDFDLDGGLVSDTLEASAGRSRGAGTPTSILCADVVQPDCSLPSVAMCLNAGAMGRQDAETETLIPTAFSIMPMNSGKDYKGREVDVAQPLMAGGPVGGNQGGDFVVQPEATIFKPSHFTRGKDGAPADISPPLSADADKGDQDSVVLEPVAYRTSGNCGAWETGDKIDALTTATDPNSHVIAFSSKDSGNDATEDMSPTLRSMSHADSHANGGGQVAVAFALRGREDGAQVEISGEKTNALRAAEGGSSRDYVDHAIQAGALRENLNSGPDGVGVQSDIAYTLEARSEVQAVGFAQNQRDEVRLMDVAGALASDAGMKQQTYVNQAWSVRRLTPVECARLQGFPDRYLDITYRGKDAADGPKYKALGNSWAVPVGRYIMERIERFMP